MTTVLVSLAVFVALLVAVVAFVSRRDRNRSSSCEDRAAVRDAGADQARHEAERHFVQGQAAGHQMPHST
ncbi:hypothetical protein [Micromonospora chersina]|uniref:Uncharacterized protein n=1 Tax=Micromonospora chersina TaxID=47854 RepID=A0A1C6VD61_9ACTN|nr:hypothetical protein [Micromonospora chersina]SCL64321.1 hypothetical protein GA0070603_3766 [Micromonospora chersina]